MTRRRAPSSARGLPSLVVKVLSCLDRRSSQFNQVILKRSKGVAFEVPCRLVALGSPLFDLPLAGPRSFESLTTEDDEATNECPKQAPYNIHKDLRPSLLSSAYHRGRSRLAIDRAATAARNRLVVVPAWPPSGSMQCRRPQGRSDVSLTPLWTLLAVHRGMRLTSTLRSSGIERGIHLVPRHPCAVSKPAHILGHL